MAESPGYVVPSLPQGLGDIPGATGPALKRARGSASPLLLLVPYLTFAIAFPLGHAGFGGAAAAVVVVALAVLALGLSTPRAAIGSDWVAARPWFRWKVVDLTGVTAAQPVVVTANSRYNSLFVTPPGRFAPLRFPMSKRRGLLPTLHEVLGPRVAAGAVALDPLAAVRLDLPADRTGLVSRQQRAYLKRALPVIIALPILLVVSIGVGAGLTPSATDRHVSEAMTTTAPLHVPAGAGPQAAFDAVLDGHVLAIESDNLDPASTPLGAREQRDGLASVYSTDVAIPDGRVATAYLYTFTERAGAVDFARWAADIDGKYAEASRVERGLDHGIGLVFPVTGGQQVSLSWLEGNLRFVVQLPSSGHHGHDLDTVRGLLRI